MGRWKRAAKRRPHRFRVIASALRCFVAGGAVRDWPGQRLRPLLSVLSPRSFPRPLGARPLWLGHFLGSGLCGSGHWGLGGSATGLGHCGSAISSAPDSVLAMHCGEAERELRARQVKDSSRDRLCRHSTEFRRNCRTCFFALGAIDRWELKQRTNGID